MRQSDGMEDGVKSKEAKEKITKERCHRKTTRQNQVGATEENGNREMEGEGEQEKGGKRG